ncbi:MAG TPA: acetylglutamate kinase [Thermoanaerobaculia bacterium]|nr:acetylglutamate kinase [Thermoanaerobaculia bacterium]
MKAPLTVVKLGGSLLEDSAQRHRALSALAKAWQRSGKPFVVVHGGGKNVDAMMQKLGLIKKTAGGLRVTDDPTLQVVVSILAGSVNKMLVSELHQLGVTAAGLSGADGNTIEASQHPPIDGIELGHVGFVTGVNTMLIDAILAIGMMPLISSVAIGSDGALFNVNADSVAAAIATELRAERLLFLTDVPGLKDGRGEIIHELQLDEVSHLVGSGAITGGMLPKVQAAVAAMRSGVHGVVIAGPDQHITAMLEGKGGTHLVAA